MFASVLSSKVMEQLNVATVNHLDCVSMTLSMGFRIRYYTQKLEPRCFQSDQAPHAV